MTDAQRRAIWLRFADQFLDSEERTYIPTAALACVEAGCSIAEARAIWRYEVTPAVWPNVWSVAGEWGVWDESWLVERIERLRRRWINRVQPLAAALYRSRAWHLDSCFRAIAGCMAVLESTPQGRRAALAADLETLAQIYFDFLASRAVVRPELPTLYAETFLPIFRPLAVRDPLSKESPEGCDARVREALARSGGAG